MHARSAQLGLVSLLLLITAFGCKSEREAISLVALFDTAEMTSSLANLNDGVRTMEAQIGGESKSSIYLHPTSTVSYWVDLPQKALLRFTIALVPEVWDKEGDGVEFVVLADDGSGEKQLYSRYIDPKHDPQARRWIEGEIDVSAYGGKKVKLTLATGPGPNNDPTYDWAVWGDPIIVAR